MTYKSELDRFGQLFKQNLNETVKATLRWVTCTVVDWEAQTMTATDSDELPYNEVLLGVGAVVVKPVLNTDCLIAIIEGDESTAFLLYADEAELTQFNGGENGGLALAQKIATNQESIKNYVEAINAALPGAFVAIGVGTAANGTLGKESYDAAMTGKSITIEEIEDTKITH